MMGEYRIDISKTDDGLVVLTVMRVFNGMFSAPRVVIKKVITGNDAVDMWKILTDEEV